ncbi:hypothetical protein F3Y22_tig00111022pilonHSYRG00003 [Hibiscus syriacus]|uniref:Uncharacterized protein n=1 Tax=Hibiscus syriacus TaxID=106335 RepID=A0A6A2Z6N4_HIBSY|nr:hypothetical protein F3Y22_tig00111022pilonHSYRG00003 [Hibiscus syriacus]
MNEAGLAECIVRAVNACHPSSCTLPKACLTFFNIILTGGSTLFPRFAERLEKDLRPLVPDDSQINIITQEDPILGVWRGGSLLASSPDYESMHITKAEYEELGSARCQLFDATVHWISSGSYGLQTKWFGGLTEFAETCGI